MTPAEERTYEREVWRRELRRIERAQSLESVVRGHVSTREAYTHRKLAELERTHNENASQNHREYGRHREPV